MQGPGGSISSIPEKLNFDRGSASNDSGLEPQMSWNGMQTSVQSRLPDYRISPNAEWGLGESSASSSQHQGDQNERKKESSWTFCPQSNIIPLDVDDENPNANQTTNGSFVNQDLNMASGFVDEEDDECQVVEYPYQPNGPPTEPIRFTGSLSTPFSMDGREDGRRMSCKRKALEGQSSGVGSYQNEERIPWHTIPPAQVATETNMPEPRDEIAISEQPNPRLRLGVGAIAPPTPFSLTSSENAEMSRRNFRLRSINGLYQQDPIPENPFSTEINVGNANVSSSRYSSRSMRNRLDLNPPPPVENTNLHGHSALNIPSVRRHHHSRWSGSSSTRSTRSSASAVSEERNAAPFGELSRSISEHPMFVPATEIIGTSSQNATNWNLHGGNNNTIAGNIASTSRVGPSAGSNSSWSHRNYPQYPRRLSEMVRRSLLSSEPGGQSSNLAIRSPSPALSQETGSESHGQRLLNARSALVDRHLDASFGITHSLRSLAAAGEARGNIMSEQIRHVLDLMRRGEGLRFEDVMILDHSVLFGMADVHDRHREMRLDVDNMSYEELLALEERIGNVCTGLGEETIASRLKQKKYVASKTDNPTIETEPCSICREEYKVGEDVGSLECGHDFHSDCIKQWLTQKNLCPICKTTGLTT